MNTEKQYLESKSIDNSGSHIYPIPESLDIMGMILANPVKGARFKSKPHKQVDRAIFLLSQILLVRFMNRDEYPNDQNFIRLCSQILKKYVKDYKRYLDYFEENGVIEINEAYQNGNRCKGYRFTVKYRHQLNVMRSIQDEKFKKRIEGLDKRASLVQLSSEIDSHGNYISDIWIKPEDLYAELVESILNISIDYKGAIKELERQIIIYDVFDEGMSWTKINCHLFYIESILQRNIYFKIDHTGGRIHTNITNLPKIYRKYINHPKVNTWVQIDIKCCQPLLLGMLMMDNSISNHIKKKYTINKITIMCPTFESMPKDGQEYMKSVLNGTFYEDFGKKVFQQTGQEYSRKKIKKIMLGILFEPVHWENPIKEIFIRIYPSIFRFMENVNKNFKKTKKLRRPIDSDEYTTNYLARLLQRTESVLMMDFVVNRIYYIHNDIPLLTIHDAILVPEEHMDLVIHTIETVFLEAAGIRPALDIQLIS